MKAIYVIGGLLIVAVSVVTAYLYYKFALQTPPSWDGLAAAGQLVGAWATSVSFICLIISIAQQRRDLQLTQSSLQAQIVELEAQRQTLQETSGAISAQLFLQESPFAERTLARHLRTIFIDLRAPLVNLDKQRLETGDWSLYAESFAANTEIEKQISELIRVNPALHASCKNYVTLYDTLKQQGRNASLMAIVFGNSDWARARQIIDNALMTYDKPTSPFG